MTNVFDRLHLSQAWSISYFISLYPTSCFFRHLSHEQICYNEDAYSRCRVCFGLLAYKHNEEQIRVVCMSVVTNISNSNLVSALCIRVFHFVTICLV